MSLEVGKQCGGKQTLVACLDDARQCWHPMSFAKSLLWGQESLPRAGDLRELNLSFSLAVRSEHFVCCCSLGLLVQEEACNECHGSDKAESKYDARCDYFFRVHSRFGGCCLLYRMSLVVSRPLDPGRSDRR